MLFVLSSGIQTGKTRWLGRLVDELARAGCTVSGVVAPGVWKDWRGAAVVPQGAQVDADGFEKLGIENVLLPQGERITFARRCDLAGDFAKSSNESAQAGMLWSIDDEAIARVNAHFRELEAQMQLEGLLVVDELGRLELELGGGLVEAIRMLEAGPRGNMRNALIVVRETLRGKVAGRFTAWGEQVVMHPDERSRQLVLQAVTGGSVDATRGESL